MYQIETDPERYLFPAVAMAYTAQTLVEIHSLSFCFRCTYLYGYEQLSVLLAGASMFTAVQPRLGTTTG
jgi:hypothetical protein